MTKKLYVFLAVLYLVSSCSKKDKTPSASSGAGVSAAVSAQLTSVDSLSNFAKFFNGTTLTDAQAADGITVLAPANSAFGNASITSTAQLPDGSSVNDYIIKGVLKASDFVNGKKLTTLSGKTLTVSVVADPVVLVNGMVINTATAFSSGTWMIFPAAQLLNAPPPVFVTVRDATQWSSTYPNGKPVAGATVGLAASQTATSYTYTGTTGADGVAVINGVQPGNYYVVASQGVNNSIFLTYAETSGGAWGYAVDTVLDAKGNLVYKDINGDGIITKADMVNVPYQQVQVVQGAPALQTLLIGQVYPVIPNYTAAVDTLNAVYSGLTVMYQDLLIMDGELSNENDCSVSSSWCPFNSFTMYSGTPQLSAIWNDAYFNNISKLNHLLRDIGGLPDATADQKTQLKAQSQTLKDFIYLKMTSYFGAIPLVADLAKDFYPYISSTSASSVAVMLEGDLPTQAAQLPVTQADGKQSLNQYAAYALAAEAALRVPNYQAVATNCAKIINSGQFSLVTTYNWFASQNTSETIWAPNFSAITNLNLWYYNGVSSSQVQYCPVIRYGEVLLMDAEAQIALGNLSQASSEISMVRNRDGLPVVPMTTAQDLTNALQGAWLTDVFREGYTFTNILRWGQGSSLFGTRGYTSMKSVMPIPVSVLFSAPGIVQNPGY